MFCPSPECNVLRVFVETAKCGLTLNRSSYAAVAANLFYRWPADRDRQAETMCIAEAITYDRI